MKSPKTTALANRLGGEKGVEDARQHLGRDTGTRIGDQDVDDGGAWREAIATAQTRVPGPPALGMDAQLALLTHGLPRRCQ